MPANITESVLSLYSQTPRVAILMSGQGTNAEAILKDDSIRDLYDIAAIATDNRTSNASVLATKYGLEIIEDHVDRFTSPEHRRQYFADLLGTLKQRNIQAAFYAGFMKISPPKFTDAIPGVNVHPADLSIKGPDGLAKYRGMRAMIEMRRDLGYVKSTVHVVDSPVDSGSALAISEAIYPSIGMDDQSVHEALKAKEHAVYTHALLILGQGALSVSDLPIRLEGERHE